MQRKSLRSAAILARARLHADVEFNAKKNWNNAEKRRLIAALLTHHPDEIEEIAKCIPSRTKEQVSEKLEEYKTSALSQDDVKDEQEDAEVTPPATQLWTELGQKLVTNFGADLSSLIGETFLVIAASETMSLPEGQAKHIRNVYVYLGEMLTGKLISCKLSKIELALVSKLLSSLSDLGNYLKAQDKGFLMVSVREYLKWKYSVLSTLDSVEKSETKVNYAFSNAWPGFSSSDNPTFVPKPDEDLLVGNLIQDNKFTPGLLYSLNPFAIPHSLLQWSFT